MLFKDVDIELVNVCSIKTLMFTHLHDKTRQSLFAGVNTGRCFCILCHHDKTLQLLFAGVNTGKCLCILYYYGMLALCFFAPFFITVRVNVSQYGTYYYGSQDRTLLIHIRIIKD